MIFFKGIIAISLLLELSLSNSLAFGYDYISKRPIEGILNKTMNTLLNEDFLFDLNSNHELEVSLPLPRRGVVKICFSKISPIKTGITIKQFYEPIERFESIKLGILTKIKLLDLASVQRHEVDFIIDQRQFLFAKMKIDRFVGKNGSYFQDEETLRDTVSFESNTFFILFYNILSIPGAVGVKFDHSVGNIDRFIDFTKEIKLILST